ncbi:MAG TPA: hypothetical protein VGO09_05285, partial [Flavisolibacter sp.]|nr:hypothetical protein [Flavisolibacter sp.]
MRTNLSFATTLLVAIFLSSCNQKYVLLDFTSAKGEVPQLSNITFRFNKTLVPDSLINSWDSTEYIAFEPKIAGRFRWESPDQLVFSPSKPLLPATSYTASIRNEVLQYSKYDKVKTGDPISFHTAPLQLTDAQVTWVIEDENTRKAVPQISFNFNYPVKPEELKEKLRLDIDGIRADYSIQSVSAGSNVLVRLNSFKGDDKTYEAKVLIEKGIKPDGGNDGTEDDIQTRLAIPSPYELIINNVESEHDGTEGVIRINTSQQLTNENIASFINFQPRVPYTVEFNDNGVTLHSEKFSAENSYALTIAKGLHGKIGGILKEDYRSSVAFGKLE